MVRIPTMIRYLAYTLSKRSETYPSRYSDLKLVEKSVP